MAARKDRDLFWRAFRILRSGQAVSRPQLAGALEISLPTASAIIADLVSAGLALSAGRAESTGGRPALMVRLNPEAAYTVGVSISQMEINGVATDLAGNIKARLDNAVSLAGKRKHIEPVLFKAIESLLSHRDLARRPVGIAVAISGIVDAERGVSKSLPFASDWYDVPLGEILSERFGLPVDVWNDVQAATLAELYFGTGQQHDHFLYLHIGRGIGLGVVAGGDLLRGSLGYAGELGHSVVDPKGPICYCGNYGCLESLASPPAIVAGAAEAIQRGVQSVLANRLGGAGAQLTIDEVFEAAKKGDRLASNLLTSAGEYLGMAVANAANMLNPQVVVLGGILADYDRFGSPRASVLIDAVARAFYSRLLPVLAQNTKLVVSNLGRHASALGAAAVAGDSFLRLVGDNLRRQVRGNERSGARK